MSDQSGMIRRVAALAFVVVVFAGAVVYFVKYGVPSITLAGSSDVDEIWLQCAKCGAEFSVTSAEFDQLPRHPQNSILRKCIRCGEAQAQRASIRCRHCDRLIVPQPFGSAFACPHCKKSLALGGEPEAPNATKPEDQKPGESDKP